MRDIDINYKSLESTYVDYEYEINEDIFLFYDYLPVIYKDGNEREYIQTLFKALILSYSTGLYQFAYIQLHMIFMVCIYYLLLQIYISIPEELENAIYYLNKGLILNYMLIRD